MTIRPVVQCMLAGALAAAPAWALAQCESAGAVRDTSNRILAASRAATQRRDVALNNVVLALDAKAKALGWDEYRKAALVTEIGNDAGYRSYQRQQQEIGARIDEIRRQHPQANDDPIEDCKAGVQIEPLMLQMREIGLRQAVLAKALIEAAR